MSKINLFCFPFAGGDFFSYRPYVEIAPSLISLMPVELPGRGRKINQPLQKDIHRLSEIALDQIAPHVHEPYAIYGHSMGALLGYLVIKQLLLMHLPPPVHLFVTGARGPSIRRTEPLRYLMTDAELKAELKSLGGVPDEVLNNKQLMDFYSVILRSDFQAVETYRYQPSEPFAIPITVIVGTQEKITFEEARAWQQETTSLVKILQFPGDHFFILKWPAEVLRTIHNDLTAQVSKTINNSAELQN